MSKHNIVETLGSRVYGIMGTEQRPGLCGAHKEATLCAGCSVTPVLSLVGLGISMAITEIKEADSRLFRQGTSLSLQIIECPSLAVLGQSHTD